MVSIFASARAAVAYHHRPLLTLRSASAPQQKKIDGMYTIKKNKKFDTRGLGYRKHKRKMDTRNGDLSISL